MKEFLKVCTFLLFFFSSLYLPFITASYVIVSRHKSSHKAVFFAIIDLKWMLQELS